MLKTKVSIVIPVYNGARYISSTLESCLEQSHTNLEIIVIDDSSDDSSFSLIQSVVENNVRSMLDVRLLRNDINLGLSKTINKAVSLCSGDYILILGHDDIILPDHISNMLSTDGLADASVIFCNASVIDSDGALLGKKIYNSSRLLSKNTNYLRSISCNNFIPSCGLLFRRSSFLDVLGWDERFKNYGEWLLWIKLAHEGTFVFSNTETARYRVHSNNISRTFSRKDQKKALFEYFDFCKKTALELDLSAIDRCIIRFFYICSSVYVFLCKKQGVFK